jgi:subtilase family serine protease
VQPALADGDADRDTDTDRDRDRHGDADPRPRPDRRHGTGDGLGQCLYHRRLDHPEPGDRHRGREPNWVDRIRLSADDTFDDGDIFLNGAVRSSNVAAGANYTVSMGISVPNVAPGNYWLVVETDSTANVGESDETNNRTSTGVSLPITIQKPDLVPTVVTGPSAAAVGSSMTVGWTIQNLGTGTATANPNWVDRIRLSTDDTFDDGDLFLNGAVRSSNVAAGSTYTVSMSVTVPNVATGNYWLVVETNSTGNVIESDEINNRTTTGVSLPITIQKPDLIPTVVTGPATASTGASITVGWTVENQGNGTATANPNWVDRIRLSTDDTFDDGDLFLNGFVRSSSLAAGSTYTVSMSVTVPNVAAGNYWLVVETDSTGSVTETSETNNRTSTGVSLPITIGVPDLTVTSITAPASANAGASISVGWTVTNQGTGTAIANTNWADYVRFSTDPVYQDSDSFLNGVIRSANVAAGGSYSPSTVVTLPNVAPGTYYLVVKADAASQVFESDETNNPATVAITIN